MVSKVFLGQMRDIIPRGSSEKLQISAQLDAPGKSPKKNSQEAS